MAKDTQNNLGLRSLRPTATPANTFYHPEVRQTAGGDGLIQLSQALSGIAPALGQIGERRFAAHKQGSQEKAIADAARMKLDSMSALKSAVDSGQIAEQNNPWYMVQLRQEVGRHAAGEAALSAWDEYRQSDIQFNDDPKAVAAWVDERFAPLLEGQDVWGAEAVAPELDKAKQSLLEHHVSKRGEERVAEREASFKTEVRSAVDVAAGSNPSLFKDAEAGDAASTASLDALAAGIQTRAADAGQTVSGLKVRGWLSEALGEAALHGSDRSLAKGVLDRLTDADGTALSETADGKDFLDRLDQKITDHQLQDLRVGQEVERQQQDKLFKGIWSNAFGQVQELRKIKPDATFFDAKIPAEQLAALTPEFYSRLRNIMVADTNADRSEKSRQDVDARKAILGDEYQKVLTGTFDPKAEVGPLQAVVLAGGDNDVATLFSVFDRVQNNRWPDTPPETQQQLWSEFSADTLTPKRVLELAASGGLGERDFNGWMERATRGKDKASTSVADAVNRAGGQVTEAITAQALDSDQITNRDDIKDEEGLRRRLTSATVDYHERVEQYLSDHPDATAEQRRVGIKDIADEVSKSHGGYSWDEYLKKQQPKPAAPVDVQPPAVKPADTADPLVAATAQIDPVVGSVTPASLDTLNWAVGQRPTGADPGTRQTKLYSGPSERWLRDTSNVEGRLYDVQGLPGNQDDEARLYREARTNAIALKRYIDGDGIVKKYADLTATLEGRRKSGSGYVTYGEKEQLLVYASAIRRYATLRKMAGYSPEEVRGMGKDAWRTMAMFANETDLKSGYAPAIEALGLKGNARVEFINTQRYLLENR